MTAETILDGCPIVGVSGVNGTGKTLLAVTAAVRALRLGRTVFSTVPVHDPLTGRRSLPITSLGQLLRIRNALIVLDEVATILPGGNAAALPSEVRVMLGTLRHAGNTVIWTAPAWMRAHVELREITQAAVALFPLGTRRVGDSPWPTPLLVGASLLDTRSGKTDEAPTRVLRRRIYAPKRLAGWGAYDTHADTPLLGRHLTGGRCPDCGGSRDVPKHTAERHAELGLHWYDDDAEQRAAALPTFTAEPVQRRRFRPLAFDAGLVDEHPDAAELTASRGDGVADDEGATVPLLSEQSDTPASQAGVRIERS